MLKHIEEFQNQINNLKNEINKEQDKYKLVELNFKLEKLTDSYNYFVKTILNNFTEGQVSELFNVNNFAEFQKELIEANNSDLLANLINNLDKGKESYDDIFNKIKVYKSKYDFSKNVTYPVSQRFEELKNSETDLSKYLLENEENIKRLTAITDNNVTDNINNHFAISMQRQNNYDRHALFTKAAKDHNISNIIDDKGQFLDKEIYTDENNYQRYIGALKELKLTDDIKNKFKYLLKEMDKMNFVDEYSSAGESKYKEYGFTKFINAKNKFIDVFNSKDAKNENIIGSLEVLKEEEKKINEMFKLIEETLKDDYTTLPGNINSFRNASVPAEFKNNLVVHSKFNSLYIMLTFIKEQGLSIDDFVENPIKNVIESHKKEFEKRNLNNILKGKTKSEAIRYIVNSDLHVPQDDPYKYSRSIQSLYLDEQNEEFRKQNLLSIVSLDTRISNYNRAGVICENYFDGDRKETLQNIFLAKENENGEIPYYDCYVAAATKQNDLVTGFVIDGRDTVIEKISKDENITETFYNSLEMLKDYTKAEKEMQDKFLSVSSNDFFVAIQDFAAKILLTIDFDEMIDEEHGKYSEEFYNDLCNIVTNYKEVEALKGFKYRESSSHKSKLIDLLNDKDNIQLEKETELTNIQKEYDEKFINEFKRINKEIDDLDKIADKIGKKIGKGKTNVEIEEIGIAQSKKFNELRTLQNERFEKLRKDYENGNISKYYFEKRSEQIQLLENLNEVPAMFLCDDKKYQNFKSYKKNCLTAEEKKLSNAELRNKYDSLISKSKEEKRLFYFNKALSEQSLGRPKFVNANKLKDIKITDKSEELRELSNLRVDIEDRKKSIVVNLNDGLLVPDNNKVEENILISNEPIIK